MENTFVNSLSKGLSVIRTLGAASEPMSNTEVATSLNIPRPTARRLLLTLVELGYVEAHKGVFELRPKCLELGYAYLAASGLKTLVSRHLSELSNKIGESCCASVLDGPDIRYIGTFTVRRSVAFTVAVGDKAPAAFTAAGRVLLAELTEAQLKAVLDAAPFSQPTVRAIQSKTELRKVLKTVKQQGFAVIDRERDEVERSLAVPVFDETGAARMAVVVPTLAAHYASAKEMIAHCLPETINTAQELEKLLQMNSDNKL